MRPPRNWLLVVLTLVGLFALSRFLPFGEWVRAFVAYVQSQGAWGPVIFAAGYVLGTILLFPGGLLTIAAGVVFGVVDGTIISLLSATIGAALTFLIARYLARKPVEEAARKNLKFQALDRAIGKKGWAIVFLTRLSPVVPFNLSNYFYGITSISFWRYLLASFLGMAPGSVLYVYLGKIGAATFSGHVEHTWAQDLFLAAGFVATVIGTFFITRLAREALQSQEPP